MVFTEVGMEMEMREVQDAKASEPTVWNSLRWGYQRR